MSSLSLRLFLSCPLCDLTNFSTLHRDPGCVHVAAVLLGSVLWARLPLCLPLCPAVHLLSLLLLCGVNLHTISVNNHEYQYYKLIIYLQYEEYFNLPPLLLE